MLVIGDQHPKYGWLYRPYAFETTNRQWPDGMGIIHTMTECLLSLSHTTTKIFEIMKPIENIENTQLQNNIITIIGCLQISAW